MNRRAVFIPLFSLLASCGRPERPLTDRLPVQIQREWRLEETRKVEMDQVPPLLRGLGVKRAMQAIYTGPGRLPVMVYEMSVGASAFEAFQKWNMKDGLAMYKDTLFVTVGPYDMNPAALSGFAKALEQDLK